MFFTPITDGGGGGHNGLHLYIYKKNNGDLEGWCVTDDFGPERGKAGILYLYYSLIFFIL